MSLTSSVVPLTSWTRKGSELVRRFGRWWLTEFLALFPRRVADWLIERGSRTLVVEVEADAVTLRLMSDRRRILASSRIDRADYTPGLIDAFLRLQRLRRRDVALGLGMPQSLVFCRSFALPLETRRSLDTVVVQDLVAKTPFQIDGVHHAHIAHRTPDRLDVWQWVVRRSHVADTLAALGLDPGEVAFIESPDARVADGPLPVIPLRPSAAAGSRWVRRVSLSLGATALLLAIAAAGAKYHRQQQLLDGLQAEIAVARAKAKAVMAAIDRLGRQRASLERLRSKRSEPGLLDIWQEATRILPPHSWLSELRLSATAERRQVIMAGFSAAAARLVPLIDASAIFTDAALAGPIAVDPAEGKERFIIQAHVKGPAKPRTAAR